MATTFTTPGSILGVAPGRCVFFGPGFGSFSAVRIGLPVSKLSGIIGCGFGIGSSGLGRFSGSAGLGAGRGGGLISTCTQGKTKRQGNQESG